MAPKILVSMLKECKLIPKVVKTWSLEGDNLIATSRMTDFMTGVQREVETQFSSAVQNPVKVLKLDFVAVMKALQKKDHVAQLAAPKDFDDALIEIKEASERFEGAEGSRVLLMEKLVVAFRSWVVVAGSASKELSEAFILSVEKFSKVGDHSMHA